jgi:pimeloyl-ACP methyl ester carboxylesterase
MTERITLVYKGVPLGIIYDLRTAGGGSVVFIHGLGAGRDCFRDVWGFSGYEQYSILTFDLPGFGDSDRPARFSYTMEDQAAVCRLLIQRLKLDKINIVGHSMGGAIGLLLAREIKPLVESFICLEGNLVSEDCTGSRAAVGYSLEDFQREGFQQLKSKISESADALFVDCLAKSDPYAFYRSSESLVKWSDSGRLLEMFLELDVPGYYFYGELNAGAPLLRRLASVPKRMIPNAGHGMMADNPSSFYRELLGVLLSASS